MDPKKETYKTQIVSHELVIRKYELNSDTTNFRTILSDHFAAMIVAAVSSLRHFPRHDLRITIRIEEEPS